MLAKITYEEVISVLVVEVIGCNILPEGCLRATWAVLAVMLYVYYIWGTS